MIEIAPGVRRLKPVSNSNRKVSFELEKRIVKDYFIEGLPFYMMRAKYGKKKWELQYILREWEGEREIKIFDPEEQKPPEPSEQVLVVDRKDVEFLLFLLHEYQIEYRIPEKFELTEYYQSKL